MAPIANEPEVLSPAPSNVPAKPQPAAVEIQVTVNGARTVEGSAKREPFSETTQTVLVFANGAVIRLTSSVAPGQLLFLTNEKSKKEVVCQVVKSKNYQNVSGYVELEFTEAAPGFWGMRFPTGSATSVASNLAKPIAPSTLAPVKTVAPAAKIPESKPAIVPEPAKPQPVVSAPVASTTAVPAEATAKHVPVPTLSEFLTQAPANTEVKPSEAAKSQTAEKASDSATKELREHTARVQNQLSAMHFTQEPEKKSEPKAPAAQAAQVSDLSKVIEDLQKNISPVTASIPPAPASSNPAPGASSFDFEDEEVKIPAWLEPLARNSASVLEMKSPESKAAEAKHGEAKLPENAGSAVAAQDDNELASDENDDSETSEREDAVLSLGTGNSAPNFGSSLSLDSSGNSESSSSGSGKGLIVGLLAAGLALAAGGGWYWYSNQTKSVSANVATAPRPTTPAVSAPEPVFPSQNPAVMASVNRAAANTAAAQQSGKSAAPAPGNLLKSNLPPATTTAEKEIVAAPPEPAAAKKPSFADVHLAAPVVNHNADRQDTAEPEPSISGNAVSGAANGINMLGSKNKQPAAPLPVGGNVKQAELISAVPPVYPQMARSQRLSGTITIDALIDANGHVGAMKVVSGPALLHQAAMDAVRQWKYKPAMLNGQPMSMHLTVSVQFKLQ